MDSTYSDYVLMIGGHILLLCIGTMLVLFGKTKTLGNNPMFAANNNNNNTSNATNLMNNVLKKAS
jgi:hypothetical protein